MSDMVTTVRPGFARLVNHLPNTRRPNDVFLRILPKLQTKHAKDNWADVESFRDVSVKKDSTFLFFNLY